MIIIIRIIQFHLDLETKKLPLWFIWQNNEILILSFNLYFFQKINLIYFTLLYYLLINNLELQIF